VFVSLFVFIIYILNIYFFIIILSFSVRNNHLSENRV
jgi:hypothetical protein